MDRSYTVLSPIIHDDETYVIDDIVVLDDNAVAPLLEIGAIELITADDVPPVITAEALADDFAKAELTEKPTVESIFSELGNDDLSVTEAVIDEAWKLYGFDATVDQIVNLLENWPPDAEPLSKKPSVEIVRNLMDDKSITTDQRNAAWDIYFHHGDEDK